MHSLFISRLSSVVVNKEFYEEIIIFCSTSNINNLDILIVDDDMLVIDSPKMLFQNYIQLNRNLKKFINEFYIFTMYNSQKLNVNFLLSNFNRSNQCISNIRYDSIITNFEEIIHDSLNKYVQNKFPRNTDIHFQFIQQSLTRSISKSDNISKDFKELVPLYKSVCVGGTFDRLHIGHKILLTNAVMIAENSITIGVTDDKMNKKKLLYEIIEPIDQRINAVDSFILKINPNLKRNIVPISDMFGPTITNESIDCLVVSEETVRGADIINEKRKELGLNSLSIEVVKLLRESEEISADSSHKVSSSTQRKALLGCLLKLPTPKMNLSSDVYIIGMTGGIASGKSSICKRLEKLGASIIDCDKLGHKSYLPGSTTLTKIVEFFGNDIIDSAGEIDRKKLGSLVFKDKEKLKKLNEIVWPAISDLVVKDIDVLKNNGKKVIVLDAAVLLEAKWDAFVHEVWTSIIPEGEAVKRIMMRNNLSEEAAKERINSQISNQERVDKSNVVFSTLWEEDVTQKQVENAWKLLTERIAQELT